MSKKPITCSVFVNVTAEHIKNYQPLLDFKIDSEGRLEIELVVDDYDPVDVELDFYQIEVTSAHEVLPDGTELDLSSDDLANFQEELGEAVIESGQFCAMEYLQGQAEDRYDAWCDDGIP